MNPIPIEFWSLLYCDEQWHVLICIEHKYVVMSDSIIRYLHDEHSLRKKDYALLIVAMSKLLTIEDPKDLLSSLTAITALKLPNFGGSELGSWEIKVAVAWKLTKNGAK
jgi:hypothetical protein